MTRAVVATMHLDLPTALLLNPFAPLVLIGLAVVLVRAFARLRRGSAARPGDEFRTRNVGISLGALLAYTLARNLA